jgi:sortase A
MKKFTIIISLLILGLLIGVSVLLYPTLADYVNSKSQSRVVARYVDDIAGMDDSKKQAMLEAARDYNQKLLYSENRFRFTDKDWSAYKQLLNTGRGVMGILAIDKINVKLAIYHGTDEGNLQIGLGHMQGTSLPVGGAGTHACITGHRGLPSSTLLSDLDRMAEGDTFVIYVMGEALTYRVDHIQTVEPHEVQSLGIDPDMDYCTLVTCTPYGVNTHRLLVRGQRTENALNAGWETVYADARRLDKAMTLLVFLIPVLPTLMIFVILQCRKIRKGGFHHR